jgi:hypothetical protein
MLKNAKRQRIQEALKELEVNKLLQQRELGGEDGDQPSLDPESSEVEGQ